MCRLTAIQQLVMEQDAKRYIPLHPTHFFHTDNKDGEYDYGFSCYFRFLLLFTDYLISTTRKDFKPPVDVVPAHTS